MFSVLSRYLQVKKWARHFQSNKLTVPLVFEEFVTKHPDKACLIFENTVWTYKMVLYFIRILIGDSSSQLNRSVN